MPPPPSPTLVVATLRVVLTCGQSTTMLVGGGYIPASGGYIYNWPLGPIVYSPPLAQILGQYALWAYCPSIWADLWPLVAAQPPSALGRNMRPKFLRLTSQLLRSCCRRNLWPHGAATSRPAAAELAACFAAAALRRRTAASQRRAALIAARSPPSAPPATGPPPSWWHKMWRPLITKVISVPPQVCHQGGDVLA